MDQRFPEPLQPGRFSKLSDINYITTDNLNCYSNPLGTAPAFLD